MLTWKCFFFEGINLDDSISSRYVRTTEQLADILTTGAFATILWKSLMLVFDLRPPSKKDVPKLNVIHNLSESSWSAASSVPARAISTACSSQRDFAAGQLYEKTKEF